MRERRALERKSNGESFKGEQSSRDGGKLGL